MYTYSDAYSGSSADVDGHVTLYLSMNPYRIIRHQILAFKQWTRNQDFDALGVELHGK